MIRNDFQKKLDKMKKKNQSKLILFNFHKIGEYNWFIDCCIHFATCDDFLIYLFKICLCVIHT